MTDLSSPPHPPAKMPSYHMTEGHSRRTLHRGAERMMHMKTPMRSTSRRRSGREVLALLVALIVPVLFTGCMSGEPGTEYIETRPVAVAPTWAPAYENARTVRYYYLPDYEIYYDVWNHEFVYPDGGRWQFARELPGPYATIDLSTAFVVVLNDRANEPWMHHQYYTTHYPRYYYLNAYNVRDARQVRGFNENGARAIRVPGGVRTQQPAPAVPPPPHDTFPTLPVARAPIQPAPPQGGTARHPGDERHPPRVPRPAQSPGDSTGKTVKVDPHGMRPHDADKGAPKNKPRDKDR